MAKTPTPPTERSVGYCANVHAGHDLATIIAQLERHAVAVRERLNVTRLPVGLWIPDSVTHQLIGPGAGERFSERLAALHLEPYTINGFPFGDFHCDRVKHGVYLPAWWERARLDYTARLARVLSKLLEPGQSGTISTLPLGWPAAGVSDAHRRQAADHLLSVGQQLVGLAEATGRRISVCLEPEPGCLMQSCTEVTEFFDRFLRPLAGHYAAGTLDHLAVCHDICHSAVMREPQAVAIDHYHAHGVRVGKVQVSSCVLVDFDQLPATTRLEALRELSEFDEDRYLHQTTVSDRGQTFFFEDLADALGTVDGAPSGTWSVHFHVPIHLDQVGLLSTSQREISHCLSALSGKHANAPDWEVETYAWNVLPEPLRCASLADGIAQELRWFDQQWQSA